MRSVLLVAVFLLVFVEVTVQQKDATSTTEKVKRIMRAVNDHCDATSGLLRRKRAASQKSEDKVRRLILNVVKDCLEGTPPTYQPPVTEYTTPTPTETTPTPTYPPVYGACTSNETLNLDEYWRKDNNGSKIQPTNNNYNCDDALLRDGKWFRIIGDAGNAIRNECPPAYSCGTHAGIWTDASMPTEVGQLITVPIYGSWSDDCDWLGNYVGNTVLMEVQRCSPKDGDFVYKIDLNRSICSVSVCSMD